MDCKIAYQIMNRIKILKLTFKIIFSRQIKGQNKLKKYNFKKHKRKF